ncbi:unnamed protein product [Adineta steineri]|uniref:Autophagy-related protein 27 n=1 Tax=Adineta steineri TaxID=433720 RepID=A0A818X4J3_9BILA|nr:unnamed protein product [Adineta steineri]CAF3733940.1 unnamed protein product [Adineta steineri]
MIARKNVAFLLFLFLHQFNILNAEDPCIYNLNTKGTIDLTSVGRTDGAPMWKDVTPTTSDNHVYSYNPCHSFTQGECKDVAVCQAFATDEKLTYSLGTQNSIKWKTTADDDTPTLIYTSGERTSEVKLRCLTSKEPDKLEVQGYDALKALYTMTLSSKCVCWDGCKGGHHPKSNDGPSVGTIFIIALLVLISVYLIAFISYNKFKLQATGIEILPHRTFWISLPRYSSAGILFVFQKVTNKKGDYNAIP